MSSGPESVARGAVARRYGVARRYAVRRTTSSPIPAERGLQRAASAPISSGKETGRTGYVQGGLHRS